MIFFCYFISFLEVIISIAFLTILERKFLSLRNMRFGPNFLFFFGIFQPFRDLIKLFFKKFIFLFYVEGIL